MDVRFPREAISVYKERERENNNNPRGIIYER